MWGKVATLAALAAIASQPAQDEPTHTVKRGNLTIALDLEGSFEPAQAFEVKINPQALNAELTLARAADHAQTVRKGDSVLVIDARRVEDAVAAAKTDLTASSAGREKAEEEWRLYERTETLARERAQREKELADQKLKLFESHERPLSLGASDQGIKRYQDSIDDQRDELAQLEKMYKSEELTNATAEIVLKRAKRQLERMLIEFEMSQKRAWKLKEIELPNQLDQLTRELAQKTLDLEQLMKTQPLTRTLKEAELAKSRLNLKKLEEQFEKLKKDAENLSFVAPFDGTVYYGQCAKGKWSGTEEMVKNLKVGEKVPAQQVLMTLVGDRVGFRSELAEADYAKVSQGMKVAITPVAFPDSKLEGSVASLATIASGGGFELKVQVGATPPRLIPGMKGKATITLDKLTDVLLVPPAFVTEENGKKIVTLKSGPREVVAGKSDGKHIQIVSGVAEGDVLVMPKK